MICTLFTASSSLSDLQMSLRSGAAIFLSKRKHAHWHLGLGADPVVSICVQTKVVMLRICTSLKNLDPLPAPTVRSYDQPPKTIISSPCSTPEWHHRGEGSVPLQCNFFHTATRLDDLLLQLLVFCIVNWYVSFTHTSTSSPDVRPPKAINLLLYLSYTKLCPPRGCGPFLNEAYIGNWDYTFVYILEDVRIIIIHKKRFLCFWWIENLPIHASYGRHKDAF